jgi:hypothetical protein
MTSIVHEQETPTKVDVAATQGAVSLAKQSAQNTAEQTEIAAKVAVVAPVSKAPVEVVGPVAAAPATEEKLVEKTSTPEDKGVPATVSAVSDAFMQQMISILRAQETRAETDKATSIGAESKLQNRITSIEARFGQLKEAVDGTC